MSAAGSALVYSTYIGGTGDDSAAGIAVDSAGNAYVTGYTASTDFPTVNPLQASNHGGAHGDDAFVAKVSPASAPIVAFSASAINFGNQVVNTASLEQSVTLTNTGDGLLNISSITATGDFALAPAATSCPYSDGSVAPQSNCAINVTFSPITTGPLTGVLTITDNSNGVAGSTQTVTLSGTGTAPVVGLSPPLTFSPQLVGTTSNSENVTLTNTGSASLTFREIAVTSPFAIATGGNCTVAVTFTPTAAGTASGSLSFTDNALNNPQTIALSGTGQDFTLTAPSGSFTSATVAPGSPATYTLSLSGQGGFNQSVSLTCTGAPSEAACTVPNSVTAGSSATKVTVSVTTTAASANMPRSRPLSPIPPPSPGLRGPLMLALVLVTMAWATMRWNQPGVARWQFTIVPLALGLLLALALGGCGGGGGGGGTTTPPNPGTPAGAYTLTVTGTTGSGSSSLSHSVTMTLTVS